MKDMGPKYGPVARQFGLKAHSMCSGLSENPGRQTDRAEQILAGILQTSESVGLLEPHRLYE